MYTQYQYYIFIVIPSLRIIIIIGSKNSSVPIQKFEVIESKKVFISSNEIPLVLELIPIIKNSGAIVTNWKNEPAEKGGNILASSNKILHNKILKLLKPFTKKQNDKYIFKQNIQSN